MYVYIYLTSKLLETDFKCVFLYDANSKMFRFPIKNKS